MLSKRALLLSTAIVSVPLVAGARMPAVVSGAVTFSQSGNRLVVSETTASAIINWQDFSVAKGETVQFLQPSATASILNRVTGSAASLIDGLVIANGRVMLLNPNGITVGPGGQITAASLLLTSSALADTDYLAGRYVFTGVPGQGNVTNHGVISAADGGAVVLSAPQVTNDGSITAHLGRVALGGGAGFTLDPAGDGLWSYQITEPAAAALVANAGAIAADGGSVRISARSLDHAMRDVINNSGMIEARSVRQQDGEIILDGGDQGQVTLGAGSVIDASAGEAIGDGGHVKVTGAATSVDGVLLARGGARGGNGGAIETSGESLTVLDSARVDIASPLGHPGNWLLDPTDFVIDSSNNSAIQTGLGSGNVTVTSSNDTVTGATASNGASPGANGDIMVNAPLTWSASNTLTLDSYHSVSINAAVSASGNTAGLVIKTNDGGAGGSLSTGSGGAVTLSGTTPSVTINSVTYTAVGSAAALQAISTSGIYALVSTINVGGAFTPIGGSTSTTNTAPTAFTGTLEGLGNSVSTFTISSATANDLGLISSIGAAGSVRDLTVNGTITSTAANVTALGMLAGLNSGTITNATAAGSVTVASGSHNVGGLVGENDGTVTASSASDPVTGVSTSNTMGGLVGWNHAGTIAQSNASGNVSATSGASNLGGLVGGNTAIVTASYATGTVIGGNSSLKLGGLVGYNSAGSQITNSYATGGVTAASTAASASTSVGGLVGQNDTTVNGSYASGTVSAGASTGNIGGLVAYNNTGTITQSYSNGTVLAGNSTSCVGGLVGRNSATILASYSSDPVTGGSGVSFAAGLVGYNFGKISYAYALGNVSGGSAANNIGTVVGWNDVGTTVFQTYGSGSIGVGAGNSHVGGLMGLNQGTVSESFWDASISGYAAGYGLTSGGSWSNNVAVSAATAYTKATYTAQSWSFAAAVGGAPWFIVDGYTRPILATEYATTIVNGHQLQLMSLGPAASYTLGANINLSATTNASEVWKTSTGFSPIGFTSGNNAAPTAFTGILDGTGGYGISNLSINITAADNLGLISSLGAAGILRNFTVSGGVTGGNAIVYVGMAAGASSGTIQNVGANGTVVVGNTSNKIGGLVGQTTAGTVLNSYSLGAVSGGSGAFSLGGLVGFTNAGSTISASYATGAVSGNSANYYFGGLVGYNSSLIQACFASGAVTTGNSGAAGTAGYVGGLVGGNGGTINQSYASGPVTTGSSNNVIGGLAGRDWGTVSASYSDGPVIPGASSTNVGGLVGSASGGVVSASYWDTSLSGQTAGSGTGVTTANFLTTGPGADAAFTASSAWEFVGNQPYPLLTAFPYVPVTVNNASKTYGQANPAFTMSLGTASNNSGAGSTAGLSFSAQSGTSLAAGTYTIGVYGSVASGYQIDLVPGTLTVNPASLTITASNQSKTYGATLALGTAAFAAGATQNGETVTAVTLNAGGKDAATGAAGSYVITPSAATGAGGFSAANYSITYATGTLTVNQAALTVTADNVSKTYGQSPSYTFTPTGLVNSDSVTGATATSSGTTVTAAVGSYSITPSAATGTGLSNYSITYATGTLTVNQAPLTITANDASKTYGQTAGFAGTAFSSSGLQAGDSVSSVSETSSGATATAAVGSYSITPSAATGTGLSNYSITYANGTLTVNQAALTITATAQSKTYGNSLTLGTTAFTAGATQNSETVTAVTLDAGGKDAASGAAGSYAITPSAATGAAGFSAANYSITYATGTLTVNQAALTVTADNVAKTYGQTPTYSFTPTGLKNSDTLTGATGTSSGTTVTAAVGTYSITPSAATGTGLSNYSITYANGTLTVNQAALTVTADNVSKTYGQTPTYSFTATGLVNGDTLTGATATSAGTTITAANGSYSITPSAATGTGLSNYSITYATGTLTVGQATLTITANDASKTYGQTAGFAGTAFSSSGLQAGDSVSSVSETSTGATATAAVGSYSITPSAATGMGLSNYSITYATGTLTVTQAALTVTATAQSKTYGNSLTLGTTAFTASATQNSETVTAVTLSANGGTAATAAAGSYTITPSVATGAAGFSAANYSITYATGALTVNTAALTVTADNVAKTYGQSPSYTFTPTGLKNSDTLTGATGTSSGTTVTAAVGTYSITPSAATGTGLSNYSITYANGTLTVNQAALTVTADNVSKTYGQTPTYSFTATGLVNGDTLTGATATSAGTTVTAANGSYSITPSAATGTGLSNYSITYATGTLTVGRATLTITANDASKTYGQTAGFAGTAFSSSGLQAGDSVSSVSETSTGATATAAVGTYNITASAASGTGLSKYSITYATGTLTVNGAPLTITATAQSKTYGNSLTLGTTAFTASATQNSETVTAVTLNAGGHDAASGAAGSYAITPSAATGAAGFSAANYSITYATGTLTVNQAALTVTADNVAKTYGQSPSYTFTPTGLKNSDTLTGATGTSSGTTVAAAVGTYSITPSAATGTGLANYSITYANGTLTVNQAALTVTADNVSKTYGQTPTYTFTPTGLVNGDTLTGATATSAGTTVTAAVGTYSITPSAATGTGLSNYSITYATGTLTVTDVVLIALTITPTSLSKTYGQTPSYSFTASGLQAGDSVTGLTETSPGTAAGATTGSYSITASGASVNNGSATGKYSITYATGTLTVNQASLSITARNASKTFGSTATFAGTAFTTSGLLNGDTVATVSETSPGTPANAAVGSYSIIPSAATGSGLANYSITYANGALTVNAADPPPVVAVVTPPATTTPPPVVAVVTPPATTTPPPVVTTGPSTVVTTAPSTVVTTSPPIVLATTPPTLAPAPAAAPVTSQISPTVFATTLLETQIAVIPGSTSGPVATNTTSLAIVPTNNTTVIQPTSSAGSDKANATTASDTAENSDQTGSATPDLSASVGIRPVPSTPPLTGTAAKTRDVYGDLIPGLVGQIFTVADEQPGARLNGAGPPSP